MPAVEYDSDASAPRGRSQWIVGAVVVAVVLLVLTRGVVTLLLLALIAAVVGVVVGLGYAAFRKLRGTAEDRIATGVG